MEGSKLKNIVILILVITNFFLGLIMVVQGVTSSRRQTQTLLDAVDLLADRGIAVNADALPQDDFPAAMTVERDSDWERQQFAALLGENFTAAQRGLVSYYQGDLGRAEVLEDGSFTVSFTPGALPTDGQELSAHGLATLRRIGFDARVTAAGEDTLEAVQLLNGFPIFSCTVALRYENGALTQLSGTRLIGIPAADPSQSASLSTATLLLRFRSGIIDSGDACSAIRTATQGYVLSAASGGTPSLTPVLRLETDTGVYRVDALTGAFSRG